MMAMVTIVMTMVPSENSVMAKINMRYDNWIYIWTIDTSPGRSVIHSCLCNRVWVLRIKNIFCPVCVGDLYNI